MIKIFDRKNIVKEAGVLLIAVLVVLSSGAVMANTEKPLGTARQDGYTMKIENSTACQGETDHVIEVTGSWEEEVFSYATQLKCFSNDLRDINITDVNLDGCVGENPEIFSWHTGQDEGNWTVSVYVGYSTNYTTGNGIPAGEGKLFNIVVDIDPTAEPQIIDITNRTGANSYYVILDSPWEYAPADINPGYLEILENNPPGTPDQPDGETNGYVDVEYTYTSKAIDPEGHDIFYAFFWNDGSISEWLGPYASDTEVEASHTWTEEGVYDVCVLAMDIYGARSNLSESLTVEIIEAVPELVIESITGGNGVTAVIKNVGNGDATNVEWDITIVGGLLLFTDESSGIIDTLAPDATEEVTLIGETFLGIGIGLGILTDIPEITVHAICDEGSSAEESITARIIRNLVIE